MEGERKGEWQEGGTNRNPQTKPRTGEERVKVDDREREKERKGERHQRKATESYKREERVKVNQRRKEERWKEGGEDEEKKERREETKVREVQSFPSHLFLTS